MYIYINILCPNWQRGHVQAPSKRSGFGPYERVNRGCPNWLLRCHLPRLGLFPISNTFLCPGSVADPMSTHLLMANFYDVLRVSSTATVDEIKLAFKRRALQVHPDKGGSKEEFHLVYQALETLADPKARKKYDAALALKSTTASAKGVPRPKKKTTVFSMQKPSAQGPAPRQPAKPSKNRPQSDAKKGAGRPQSPESQQTKLLKKIQHLLQQLPRDRRHHVITTMFSQQQREMLERWMVDAQTRQPQPRQPQPVAVAVPSCPKATAPSSSEELRSQVLQQSQGALALPDVERKASRRKASARIKDKAAKQMKRIRSMCGTITKERGWKNETYYYRTRLRFDAIDISTGKCDLPTALEYLVILTAVKQKMRDPSNDATFEQRLQEALATSAKEQGKSVAELNLRFSVLQAAAFFVGPGCLVRTPKVRSIEALGRIRECLQSFPQYGKHIGLQSVFWRCSPAELQDGWERFQTAVVAAWEIAGEDSIDYMRKLRLMHEASVGFRTRHLQIWEQRHMAMQDRNRHRPKRLQDRSTKPLECQERLRMAAHDKQRPRDLRKERHSHFPEPWEREQMALADKNKQRPRRLRVPLQRNRQRFLSRILAVLSQVLARWERILRREAELAEKEQRRVLRQRELDQKKEMEEQPGFGYFFLVLCFFNKQIQWNFMNETSTIVIHRSLGIWISPRQRRRENLSRKRQREEERERREFLAKKMRSDLTMDEILGTNHGVRRNTLHLWDEALFHATWATKDH